MIKEIKTASFAKIKESAIAVSGWDNMHDAWLDIDEDSGCAVVGHNASGELYPIAIIDCAQYDQPEESIKLAEFYASANPKAILELISSYEAQQKKISELEKKISSQMNFGERMIIDSNGDVVGDDTGRLVAKFSHWNEAESFCEAANFKYSLSKKI